MLSVGRKSLQFYNDFINWWYSANIFQFMQCTLFCVVCCLCSCLFVVCICATLRWAERKKRGLSDFIWIKSSLYIRLLIVFKHTSRWTVFLLLYSGRSFNLVFSSCCSFAPHGSVRRVCLFLCHCLGRTQHVNFNKGLHERAKHWSFFLHLFHAI